LKAVRGALRDADPDLANVAELARLHGFTHPGRFAWVYSAAFGESPVEHAAATLKATIRCPVILAETA
jgi:hypothetical protein